MNTFLPSNILIPQVDSMEKWAVIAVDQFHLSRILGESKRRSKKCAFCTEFDFTRSISRNKAGKGTYCKNPENDGWIFEK